MCGRPALSLNIDALDTPRPSPADERDEYISAQSLRSWRLGCDCVGDEPGAPGMGGEGEQGVDMFFEEEELGPLEKIYLFSRSRAVFHR